MPYWPGYVLLASIFLSTTLSAGEPAELKARGPEHNVTLNEEPRVLDLLNKAQKARARAEKDPEAWPECIKYYTEILNKYPNTVYLDRWEGPDKKIEDMPYELGLYKSTRERVARDIASLPPAGLAIYRVINDPAARNLFADAQEQFDERKMEQIAQSYFATSWGDDAAAWLGELASDRRAPRQAVVRYMQALAHPNPSLPAGALNVRMLLAQIQLNDRVGAEKTLKKIQELAAEKPESIRLGKDEGEAAVKKLAARSAALGAATADAKTGNVAIVRSWETYFGNSGHNLTPPTRSNIGLRKWSQPIRQLLYGPSAEVAPERPNAMNNDGTPMQPVQTMNHHLTIYDGYFYICDAQTVWAYPIGNPSPGAPSVNGNAKFVYPGDAQAPPKMTRDQIQIQVRRGRRGYTGLRHQPYYCTVGDGRLFAVLGPEPVLFDPDNGQRGDVKQPTNYLVALGRQATGGSLNSGKLVWSLQPSADEKNSNPAFDNQSKADQEWLRAVHFTSSPVYESGVLYALAVQAGGGLSEAWACAFDADTGQIIWRTQICSANPIFAANPVQPALGLPVGVANGSVFVVTNLGAVAAIDALSGGIKWIRVYDRVAGTNDRFNQYRGRSGGDFWGPNPPIVHENMVVITPQDSDRGYAYDIETGRRIWFIERVIQEREEERLKHVLGITHNQLAISGNNLRFYELKTGRLSGPLDPLPLESQVKGRGLATKDMVLLPTEKALYSISTALIDGKFRPKLIKDQKWKEPEIEAGNVFVAGDVLYTVSATHVNAFFVWEEMEGRLKERLRQAPDDLGAYNELADVYHKVEKFDMALDVLDKALPIATKSPNAATELATIQKRRFDAHYERAKAIEAKNEPGLLPDAYASYKKALDVAQLPGLTDTPAVDALRAMAENAIVRKEFGPAAQHYQEIILKRGDVLYKYKEGGHAKARLFAQSALEELKKSHPESYVAIEEHARKELADAMKSLEGVTFEIRKFEAVLANYPNSIASGDALLWLANYKIAPVGIGGGLDPDGARQYAVQFLSRFRESPRVAEATAILAAAYEKSNMLGPAMDVLKRLSTRPEFADKTMDSDPFEKAKPAAPIKVAEWAANHLTHKQFQRAPSAAVISLGDGKLKLAWTRPAAENSLPITCSGMPPAIARQLLLYAEGNELSALSVANGDEVWLPRLKLPDNYQPNGVWAEHLLLIFGTREVVAYDARDKGKIVWRHAHGPQAGVQSAQQASDVQIIIRQGGFQQIMPAQPCSIITTAGRVVIGYPSGQMNVLDAISGKELWQTKAKSNLLLTPPAAGEGFIAVAASNPGKLFIYDLDSGVERGSFEVPADFNLSPIAQGDRVFFSDRNQTLRALDSSAKLIWEHKLGGTATAFRVTRELILAVLDGRQVIALNTEGAGERRKWAPHLPTGSVVRDLHIDGEDLYVAVSIPSDKSELFAYSVPSQLKMQWRDISLSTDMSTSLPLNTTTVTGQHLVVTEPNWDKQGDKPTVVAVVERKSGRHLWTQHLATDNRVFDADGTVRQSFRVQIVDGGVVLTEARKRSAYLAGQVSADPEKAMSELSAQLGTKTLTPANFSAAYDEFARLRQTQAQKQKRTFAFAKIAAQEKLLPDSPVWSGVKETALDGWPAIYLPGDVGGTITAPPTVWQGSADLSATFRGAYDQKNLYMLFVVTDDKHKNENTEGVNLDFGDSVRVAFDIDRNSKLGYEGKDFVIGAALNEKGTVLGWRFVENGKFLTGNTPLQAAPVVARNEEKKQTIYQITVPLDYLSLKAEPETKFGFSFAINDQDDKVISKSLGASPGMLPPPWPSLFAEGELQK